VELRGFTDSESVPSTISNDVDRRASSDSWEPEIARNDVPAPIEPPESTHTQLVPHTRWPRTKSITKRHIEPGESRGASSRLTCGWYSGPGASDRQPAYNFRQRVRRKAGQVGRQRRTRRPVESPLQSGVPDRPDQRPRQSCPIRGSTQQAEGENYRAWASEELSRIVVTPILSNRNDSRNYSP